MKIGKFSENNNVSIDTIRHYMDIGMINPDKIGGHYSFDEKCQNNMTEIIKLKDMGFTLSEIKIIWAHKSLGKLTRFQENEEYKGIYKKKLRKLEDKIEEISNMRENLAQQIRIIESIKSEANFALGFDLGLVDKLKCIKCSGNLKIGTATVDDGQIIDGILKCGCGKSFEVVDGILYINHLDRSIEKHMKFNIDDDIIEYIQNTDNGYLDNIIKSIEWSSNKIDYTNMRNKFVLELGIGSGFYLRSIYNGLSDEITYVGVDYRKSSTVSLKRILERANVKKNVNLICAYFEDMPFKDNVFDVLVDYTGTSNFGFENKEFLLNISDKFMKRKSLLIGTYIIFEKFGPNRYIKEGCSQNFVKEYVVDSIKNLNYHVQGEMSSHSVNKGGKFERFFDESEKVYSYVLYGKRDNMG